MFFEDIESEKDYLMNTIEKAEARLEELSEEEQQDVDGGWTTSEKNASTLQLTMFGSAFTKREELQSVQLKLRKNSKNNKCNKK